MTDMFDISGRIAVVTGGSRGIGRMIAEEFVRRGVRTYITARKADACRQTAAELSEFGECIALPRDLSSTAGIAEFVADLATAVIAQTEVELDGIRANVRSMETNEGNLIADSQLWQAGQLAGSFGVAAPDVAIQNGGGLRATWHRQRWSRRPSAPYRPMRRSKRLGAATATSVISSAVLRSAVLRERRRRWVSDYRHQNRQPARLRSEIKSACVGYNPGGQRLVP